MTTFPRRWTGLQIGVILGALLYGVAVTTAMVLPTNIWSSNNPYFHLFQSLPYWAAAVSAIIFAFRGKHANKAHRAGWILVALAWFFLGAAGGIKVFGEFADRAVVKMPGLSEAIHLAAFPLLLAGVISLLRDLRSPQRARTTLDSLIAVSSIGILSWYYLIRPLWDLSNASVLGRFVGIAYPLADLVALFGALLMVFTAHEAGALRRPYTLLAAAIVLQVVSDMSFSYDMLDGSYQAGRLPDCGWYAGCIALCFASLLPLVWPDAVLSLDFQRRSSPSKRIQPWKSVFSLLLPYVAIAVAFSLVAERDYSSSGTISKSTFMVGCTVILFVVLRQVLTMLENHTLADRLLAFTEKLEDMVDQRTAQLTALHKLTRVVNETLVAEDVLDAAIDEVREILPSDGALIWLYDSARPISEQVLQLNRTSGLDQWPDLLRFAAHVPARNAVECVKLPRHDGSKEEGTLLRAPLRWQQRQVGLIGVIRFANEFDRSDEELLESIGLEVGTALENARQYGAAIDAADRDSVTGLFNHRALHQRLANEVREMLVTRRALTVMMIDVDNFKLFNDTYGHLVGDQVLKRAGSVLTEVFGYRTIIGRYGGDEFAVIMPGVDSVTARQKALDLAARMVGEGFRSCGDARCVPVTMSIGIASMPEDGVSGHELLMVADANLYIAKYDARGVVATSDRTKRTHSFRRDEAFNVLDSMVTAVDNKDRYTRQHSENVTEYALWIAEELGLSDETMRIIHIGALLHDVGKIGVPDDILRKPGRLTNAEFDVMKRHPELGAMIVGAVAGMENVLDAVRHHHERWDGTGYPDGLKGNDIPLLARLMAVADAVSAMTTDRPYRQAFGWEKVLDEVTANSGTQFDPIMTDAFIAAARHRLEGQVRIAAGGAATRLPRAA